ncbi:MAG TPA: glycosyltransferase [Puia sp.]|uniref:glycosyltransferase n=1 Tax=Puia sp. TaxID=2045100 RepID=UPI002BC22B4C|nr:glycosyltransferase [Puia sp.]HVU98802.1 glycosyltransferase [Puia sp.]
MLILLDCRPLSLSGPDTEKGRLLFTIAAALARDPGVQWLLVAGPADSLPELPGARLIRRRVLPGKLGWRLWYDVQLPRLAKKHKAGLVMTTGGVAARTPLPQCLWMPERANPRDSRSWPPLYPARLTDSLHRARSVICYSDRDRSWLTERGPKAANKLLVLHPFPAGPAAPLSLEGREQAKAEFAQGREYFLADATAAGEEGLINLLKAFSLFKRRQQSNLQLLVKGIPEGDQWKKLDTYKYREDVHACPPAPAADARLMSGAYAFLFLYEGNSLGQPLLDAWKSGVPVIAATGGVAQDLAGDAVLTANGADPASLATHLMSVYKDEQLRSRLIARGKARLEAFDPECTVDAVRALIGRSVESPEIS